MIMLIKYSRNNLLMTFNPITYISLWHIIKIDNKSEQMVQSKIVEMKKPASQNFNFYENQINKIQKQDRLNTLNFFKINKVTNINYIIIINFMNEQQKQTDLVLRQFSSRKIGKIKMDVQGGSVLKVKRKVSQLQNKAYFFEGQLNPLFQENKQIKEELIALRKQVLLSAQILRTLLPAEQDVVRKLKIQMAGIQEISIMIKDDWQILNKQLNNLNSCLNQKNKQISSLQQNLNQTISSYQTAILELNNIHHATKQQLLQKISQLQQQIVVTMQTAKKQKQQLQKSFKDRLDAAVHLQKQFNKYVLESEKKYQYYVKLNDKLKAEIAFNQEEFEKNKQNMKQIYEKMMDDKMKEQQESYEFVLKLKEQQKFDILLEMDKKQEQYKMLLSEKHSQISHLSGVIDKFKEEIGRNKDQIWNIRLKMDDKDKEIKNLQTQICNEKHISATLKKQMKTKEEDYHNQIQSLIAELSTQKEKYKILSQNYGEQLKKLQVQKLKNQNQLKEKNDKLIELRRKMRENDEKFEKDLAEQQKRTQFFQILVNDSEKLYKSMMQAANSKVNSANNRTKLMEMQLQQTINKHKQAQQELEKKHAIEKQNIEDINRSKLERIKYQYEEEKQRINKEHQRKISEIEVQNNQYIRNLVIQQSSKLSQQQKIFKQLQKNANNELKELRSERSLLLESEAILRKQKEQQNKIMEMEKYKNQQQLKQQIETFTKALRDRQFEYEQKLLNFERQIRKKQEEFEVKISKIKQDLQNQINILKQTNAVEAIENKYELIIEKLKEAAKVQLLKKSQQMQAKLQYISNQHDEQITKLNNQHNQNLNNLEKQMQFNLSQLNQDLLNQKQAHQFSKLTKEQKIAYLIDKINIFKEDMITKQDVIVDLEISIEKKDKQIAKIDQIVLENIQRIKNEMQVDFNIKIEEKVIECSTKVKVIETERIKHTHQIYHQFEEIKKRHLLEISTIQRKYEELEFMFQQRPSRTEDLNKIKSLIQQKSKLGQQMIEFKKKVKEANQIVKYLNLQLQNYKETYDIFGPLPQSPPHEKRSSEKKINQTEFECNAMKTFIDKAKKATISLSPLAMEEYKKPISVMRNKIRKRINTESSDTITQFNLFPYLSRKKSIASEEEGQSEQKCISQNKKEKNRDKQGLSLKKPVNLNKYEPLQKSDDLRSNAQIFMTLLNQHQNYQHVVTENSVTKPLYGKKNRNYKKGSQRRIQIKQKSYIFKEEP